MPSLKDAIPSGAANNAGVERTRRAIHNRVRKVDQQPSDDASPNRVAVDENSNSLGVKFRPLSII